jgi:UDP-N-acetylglucosamine 4,6-dehydratase
VEWPYRTVLITGGTGTFGQAFLRWLRQAHPEVHVRLLSRDEFKQAQLRQRFGEAHVSYLLGDVRDVERLRLAFQGVDLVVHAAALKQVDAGEYNPAEFAATNVMGSLNVMRAALDCGVAHTILLSSDKAVAPINLYGATKMVAERAFIQANHYAAGGRPRLNVVRYGNILGSRGSALSLFRQRLAAGQPLPLTHPAMTRFWMTIAEAVALVRFVAVHGGRGELWVPRLPAFALADLVTALGGPEVATELCGVRPGEKLHEHLLTLEEQERALYLPPEANDSGLGLYVGRPAVQSWQDPPLPPRDALTPQLCVFEPTPYSSERWPWRLSVTEIQARLQTLEERDGG